MEMQGKKKAAQLAKLCLNYMFIFCLFCLDPLNQIVLPNILIQEIT